MSFSELLASTTSLVIFDLDWTLIKPLVGDPKKPHFRAYVDDWQEIPGRTAVIEQLRAAHIEIAIATNQGGVAYGIYKPEEMARQTWTAAMGFGVYFCYFCFDHPGGSRRRFKHESPLRKPGAGMIWRAMLDAHVDDPQRVLFVGDRDEDRMAAENAGVRFMDTAAFFAQFPVKVTEPSGENHPSLPF